MCKRIGKRWHRYGHRHGYTLICVGCRFGASQACMCVLWAVFHLLCVRFPAAHRRGIPKSRSYASLRVHGCKLRKFLVFLGGGRLSVRVTICVCECVYACLFSFGSPYSITYKTPCYCQGAMQAGGYFVHSCLDDGLALFFQWRTRVHSVCPLPCAVVSFRAFVFAVVSFNRA